MENDFINKMTKLVQDRLTHGESRESIIKILTDTGMNPETAYEFVNSVPLKKNNNKIMSFFLSVFSLLIGFLILNGILYVGQELYYMNDVKKCEYIESEINNKKAQLTNLKSYIDSTDLQYDELIKVKESIKKGLSKDIVKYDKLVKFYKNSFKIYKQKREKYNFLIDEHNKLTHKYNNLSKKAYRRWWLLPIPFPGKSH